jgi:hypothetical protein
LVKYGRKSGFVDEKDRAANRYPLGRFPENGKNGVVAAEFFCLVALRSESRNDGLFKA